MKKTILGLLIFLMVITFSCKKQVPLEINGTYNGIPVKITMNYPPQLSFTLLAGWRYRSYGTIEIKNNTHQNIDVFFVDLNIDSHYLKCKNASDSLMQYVDEVIPAGENKILKVCWDLQKGENHNFSCPVNNIKCFIRKDLLGEKIDDYLLVM